MRGHELKIHSLGDVDASCSCGGWSLTGTGARTIEHVRNVWEFHVKQQLAHVETVYGERFYVSRADLDGTKTQLPLYFSTGRAYADSCIAKQRFVSTLHRDNIARVLR